MEKLPDLEENSHKKFSDWHDILSESINTAEVLAKYLPVDISTIRKVTECYPMRINPYYLSLMINKGDHLRKQAVPDLKEIEDISGSDDPSCEERQSPVPNLTHRYPDRALFMVSNQCALYCRFCMRKRKVGRPFTVTDSTINAGMEWIRKNNTIHEVILSGGDPLLLEDDEIDRILGRLRSIKHVEIIRIHSRIPCTLPQRITKNLADTIRQHHPLFVNTHFNHPDEITKEAAAACAILSDAGIPLGCQTVLLKGVNDTPHVMQTLMKKLLTIRIRPYYIHHPDLVRGTSHFRTTIKEGLGIIRSLHGYVSGLCVPQYMIDLPGGGGKVPLLPEYIQSVSDEKLQIENFRGEIYNYPETIV
ncbi:MAG: KamA family radical SAM protein [Desulfobacteraceae bacterium]|nr:MAG: KamA family radical SAM protein [Desulfobacteraceae bacterium]